jgi:hypothetical protein
VWRYLSLTVPIAALAVNVIAQVMLVRLRKGTHFLRSVVEGCFSGMCALAAMEAFLLFSHDHTGETVAIALLVNFPTYMALSYCYFNFANLGQSSIRIRIYSEIAGAADGVRIEQIGQEYNEDTLMQMRLQRLTESGDLCEKEGLYFIGKKRLTIASKVIFALKKFILSKESEFE